MVIAATKLKDACSLEESYDKPRQHIKKQRYYFANRGLCSQSHGISSSHVCMSELDHKEGWVSKNWWFWAMVLEKTLESPLDCKEVKSVLKIHWKDWCLSWNSNTLATGCEELTHWKRLWCWERLKAGEGDDRGWDGWMATATQWTWVWVNSGSSWRTGKLVCYSPWGGRVRHDWVTELNCHSEQSAALGIKRRRHLLWQMQVTLRPST